LPPEIGRNPKLIVGIVVVSVAVGIYIAEVVGVVVIRRSLPPINRKSATNRKFPYINLIGFIFSIL
jgi:hypothetical protein